MKCEWNYASFVFVKFDKFYWKSNESGERKSLNCDKLQIEWCVGLLMFLIMINSW